MTREEAIEYWNNHYRVGDKEQNDAVYMAVKALERDRIEEAVEMASETLKTKPPGHWREKKQSFSLVTGEEATETFLECDQCQAYGPTEMLKFWNYCPKCGSRMKGVWVE